MITPRLREIINLIKSDSIADIGTDHASIATEAKIVEKMREEGITKEEGHYYITGKLKGAGCNQTVFEDAASEAILNAADGTPRMINKYCNQSMLIGDSSQETIITTDIVMQAINDCELG